MDRQNIRIKFHGTNDKTPPAQLEDYLESLMRHAPSGSICYLHVFKEPKGYLCKLTVHSTVRIFSAQSKNNHITPSIKDVLRDVKAQIATWKKNRSTTELTGVTSITELNLNHTDSFSQEDEELDLLYKKAA